MRTVFVAAGVMGFLFCTSPFRFVAIAADHPIVINEVFYDASGSDENAEWVELFNADSVPVDMSGWKIERAGTNFQNVFSFPDGTVLPGGAFLVVGGSTIPEATFVKNLGLTNASGRTDGVRLLNNINVIEDAVLYGMPNTNSLPDRSGNTGTTFAPTTPEGTSLIRIDDAFSVTTHPTPARANDLATPTPSPTPSSSPSASPSASATPISVPPNARVVVNEVLPNPAGSDENGEFMELKNLGESSIDISGWKVDDADGGSTSYTLPLGTHIPADGLLLLKRTDTKLAFNNDTDHARLLHPDESLAYELLYDDVPGEDIALARRNDGTADWTSRPTPGEENVFVVPSVEKASSSASAKTTSSTSRSSPSPTASTKPVPHVRGVATALPVTVSAPRSPRSSVVRRVTRKTTAVAPPTNVHVVSSVEELHTRPLGSFVSVQAPVSVLPHTLDAHLFYLAGSGIGVVVLHGEPPVMALGDTVLVSGVLEELHHERFLVANAKTDIQKTGSGAPPTPHIVDDAHLAEASVGSLLTLRGRITGKGNEHFLVRAGEEPLPLIAPFLSDISSSRMASVTGILSKTEAGFRLLPRSLDDIQTLPTPSSFLVWWTPKRILAGILFLFAIVLALVRGG